MKILVNILTSRQTRKYLLGEKAILSCRVKNRYKCNTSETSKSRSGIVNSARQSPRWATTPGNNLGDVGKES